MPHIRFLTAVMCDEVRREESGRAILLGVAMAGPSVSSEKELVIDRLGFYMEAEVSDVDEAEIRLVQRATNESAFDATVTFDFESMEKATPEAEEIDPKKIKGMAIGTVMFLAMDNVAIPASGWYDLQYRIEGMDDWEQIRDFLFPVA